MTPESELYLKLAELLRQRIGLNPASVGSQMLEHAVQHRLKALQLNSVKDYPARLISDPGEWNEFLEEIIVPESWFFRESTPFQCVREFVNQAQARPTRQARLRFLSIPCSRGEEPYSLAMTLLDAGLLPSQFEIVGCDVSQRSLDYARRGRYRSIAFRENDPISSRLTRQHFQILGDELELSVHVRTKVHFQLANLASASFAAGLGSFDFIFCRNVLIYLTEEVRQRTLDTFRRMLTLGGVLYLGHSECRLGPQAGAVAWHANFPAAFTWSQAHVDTGTSRRVDNVTATTTTPPALHSNFTARASHGRSVGTPLQTPRGESPASSAAQPGETLARADLQYARHLANSGQLDQAETLCQRLLRDQPTNVEVCCLLGVILQSRGSLTQAEVQYQKALFLAPDHTEALTHMLRLAQLRRDQQQVANYQRRLRNATMQDLKT